MTKSDYIIPIKGKPCQQHNSMNKEIGFLAWNVWAEKMSKSRHKQVQCVKCGYWFFLCEL